MSAQHTPGPWHWDSPVWDYDPENDAPWLVDAADKRVLWGGIKCDSEADAHLIAAAPELLDALKRAVSTVECEYGRNSCAAYRALIAKAEGKAS